MIDIDIGWEIVKVAETELSDEELMMIWGALQLREEQLKEFAQDKEHLELHAQRQMRKRMRIKMHPIIDFKQTMQFFRNERKQQCLFHAKEYHRLSELFFEVIHERHERQVRGEEE